MLPTVVHGSRPSAASRAITLRAVTAATALVIIHRCSGLATSLAWLDPCQCSCSRARSAHQCSSQHRRHDSGEIVDNGNGIHSGGDSGSGGGGGGGGAGGTVHSSSDDSDGNKGESDDDGRSAWDKCKRSYRIMLAVRLSSKAQSRALRQLACHSSLISLEPATQIAS